MITEIRPHFWSQCDWIAEVNYLKSANPVACLCSAGIYVYVLTQNFLLRDCIVYVCVQTVIALINTLFLKFSIIFSY